jgi:hypothetical protein
MTDNLFTAMSRKPRFGGVFFFTLKRLLADFCLIG